ncbi:hypothetical protein GGS24DRAFT_492572 [Hypoxylon argillaceum]|nr:hypothetical protein GGS24DRAFT_492572 [Hypoxylon argillaceum]
MEKVDSKLPDQECPINTSKTVNGNLADSRLKTRRDSTSEVHRSSTKRGRLTRAGARTEDEETQENAKTTIQGSLLEIEPTSAEPQSQKPQCNSSNKQLQPKRAPLTRKNLARFNRMAGTNGSKQVESAGPSIETKTTTTKISTTWDTFARKAHKNGILHPINSKPPTNIEFLRQRFAQPRGSPPPTPSEFQCYEESVAQAMNELTIQMELVSQLLKKYTGFVRAIDQQCTAFPKNVGFNNGLRALKPDFLEGLGMQQFDPFPVDQYIEGAIFQDKEFPITLPHIAGELKARGKDLDTARIQASYDGASLVYGRNQALEYLGQDESSSNAEVTTFITNGSVLKIYAHYAAPGRDGAIAYNQYLIKSVIMDSYEGFIDGRKQLRNAQEYAKEQSCLLRDQLKEQWDKNNINGERAEDLTKLC